MKALVTSNTTQNVALGTSVSAAGVATVIATVRTQFPDLPLWPETYDLFIGGLVAAVLGAFISRWIAFFRHPEKAENAK